MHQHAKTNSLFVLKLSPSSHSSKECYYCFHVTVSVSFTTAKGRGRQNILLCKVNIVSESGTIASWKIHTLCKAGQQADVTCDFNANGVTSSDVGGWLKRHLLFSCTLPSWQQLWSGGVGLQQENYTVIWSSCAYRPICMASLSVACVGFPLCNRDWFQNSSSKTLTPFFCVLWKWDGKSHRDVLFCPLSSDNISLCRSVSLRLSLILLWKQMIYVESSHWGLYVIPIRPLGLCARLCSLWVFIETVDCRTAYWRTQTLFRGNAKSHQFPIPFLISSIPLRVMNTILLNWDHWTMHC